MCLCIGLDDESKGVRKIFMDKLQGDKSGRYILNCKACCLCLMDAFTYRLGAAMNLDSLQLGSGIKSVDASRCSTLSYSPVPYTPLDSEGQDQEERSPSLEDGEVDEHKSRCGLIMTV